MPSLSVPIFSSKSSWTPCQPHLSQLAPAGLTLLPIKSRGVTERYSAGMNVLAHRVHADHELFAYTAGTQVPTYAGIWSKEMVKVSIWDPASAITYTNCTLVPI